ncbi:NUDIX domain-containing protein [Chitinophaga sp. Hz27]|uniref:NUDIX hydrolase n=1 Tax=Chitinophaga sp. Hz27 TaxID=3347169 RepID=UPI0035DDB1DC
MKIIDKLAWIEIKNKSILSTKSFGKTKCYIPGGKREPGESDAQALCREISEELNVELDPQTLHFIGSFEAQADSHPDGVSVKMTCYTANYTGELKACAEIESFTWLTSADKDKISAVDMLIFDYLKDQQMID